MLCHVDCARSGVWEPFGNEVASKKKPTGEGGLAFTELFTTGASLFEGLGVSVEVDRWHELVEREPERVRDLHQRRYGEAGLSLLGI